ncbi:MAG: MtrB/PioB family outer membrane beta-barrel protein [Xanthomonadales bacterium]|nr:MtrB/PioB family outer membrane beta-barrel protein [Xanthomonadales bacterium]
MKARIPPLLLLGCGVAMPAAALETGFWLAGLAWLDGRGEWAGRRAGELGPGGYGVLRLAAAARDGREASGRRRLELLVRDLGRPTASAALRVGVDGRGGIRLGLGRQAREEGRALTPFRGVGGRSLELPEPWTPAPSTAGLRELGRSLQSFDYGRVRSAASLELRQRLAPTTELAVAARQERRQGIRPFGGVVGTTGGNARAAILPLPIDETTRELEASLAASGPRHALALRLRASHHDDHVGSLSWRHPFGAVPGLPAESGYPRALAQAATAPDNHAWWLAASGWWRLGAGARLSGEAALGQHRQDAPFLPYTIHPDWAARLAAPLPRSSLDGRLRQELARLRFDAPLAARLALGLAFRHERRADRTPEALFRQVPSDAAPQPAQPDARWRLRWPSDWRERAVELDADWQDGGRGGLALRLGAKEAARRLAERERTRERRASLEGRLAMGVVSRIQLALEEARRSGDAYLGERPFLASFLPEYLATVPGGFENAPELRRPHLADLERVGGRALAQLALGERTLLGLHARADDDRYPRSALGLEAVRREAFGLDLGWGGRGAAAQLFLSREALVSSQRGASFRGGANRLPDLADPARRWRIVREDRIDAAGGYLRLEPCGALAALEASLAWIRYRTRFEATAGAALSGVPLPPLGGRSLLASLKATAPLLPGLDLVLEWRGERHRFRDPLARDLAVDQLAPVLLATPASAEGPAQILLLALRVGF